MFKLTEYDAPRFASADVHPFLQIEWEMRTLKNEETGWELEVECPKHWSYTACHTAATRYLRRGDIPKWPGQMGERVALLRELGDPQAKEYTSKFDKQTEAVPPIVDGREWSIKQLIHRVAFFLAKNAPKEVLDSKQRLSFYLDLCYLFVNQIIGPNTPAWINGGLYDVYGIKGAERTRYWFDPEKGEVVEIKHELERPGMAACYLTGVEDRLHGEGGMYDYILTESAVFTAGAGNGANISKIRGKGEPITGGGEAEGIIPFLKIADASAQYIKSGGTTRRAARMLVLDDDHPDVFEFINWKSGEERKVLAMADGFINQYKKELESRGVKGDELAEKLSVRWNELIDWRGEIYSTVTGQQANNSIRLSDAFMKAVEEDGEWCLRWRTEPMKGKIVKARDLWNAICEQAWRSGDPGVHFGDLINRWFTAPQYGVVKTSNPCSEVLQPDYTSCNLCSLNLVKAMEMGVDDFIDATKIIILVLETVAGYGSSPTKKHAQVTHDLRPLGANIGNLGAYLMQQGIPYDSEEGRTLTNAIISLFDSTCWEADAELASVLGSYPAYNEKNHYRCIGGWLENTKRWWNIGNAPLVRQLAEDAILKYTDLITKKPAFRNDAVTCMVPTGTIGLVMDYDTLGIEPDLSLVKWKKLAEGGGLKIVNQSIEPALRNLAYSEEEIPGMLEKILEQNTVVGIVKEEHYPVFDCAFACGAGRYISPNGHMGMMQAIGDNISQGISKTVNLPESCSVEDIGNTYKKAYDLGIKCVAVYRDNCKQSQPLNAVVGKQATLDQDDEAAELEALAELEAALKDG